MLLLTLRGTPTIYYGDEIGMPQVAIPSELVRDPFQKNVPGLKVGRDGSRTPMQWDDTRHAGFSDAETWLPFAEDFRQENVANQRREPTSMYNLYRRLIALRRSRRALTDGSYRPIPSSGDILLFVREREDDRLVIALNLGKEPRVASIAVDDIAGKLLLSSHLDREGEEIRGSIDLRPNEGMVFELAKKH
jgi:alpha-glucosidase